MLKGIKLRDYQQTILNETKHLPAIGLFMKTGSGKTLTALERYMMNGTPHLLVVCPQKIVTQWIDVIEKHTDLKPCKYNISWSAKKKNDFISNYLINDFNPHLCVVVNFDIINKIDLDWALNEDWTIIIDESHKIKNMGTARSPVKTTAKILELGELTPYKIILTATPTEKEYGGYVDFYAQLRFLGYIDMSYQLFKNRYCYEQKIQIPGMPFPIKKITGYRMDYIEREIKPIIKSCCRYYAPKYGDYEPQMIKVDIERCSNYAKMLENRSYEEITFDNVSAFRIGKKTMTSGIVSGTNEYGDRFKYGDNTKKRDWLEEFLSNTDDIVSVLYNFNVEKDVIVAACEKVGKKYIIINGDVKDKPAELKKEFDVVIGQYEAFGESLDGLQYKCHLMVFFSMPDSSRAYRQSLGRIDRIGQTEMPVYYHLVMTKTIDEKIYEMVNSKVEFSEKDLNELTI